MHATKEGNTILAYDIKRGSDKNFRNRPIPNNPPKVEPK